MNRHLIKYWHKWLSEGTLAGLATPPVIINVKRFSEENGFLMKVSQCALGLTYGNLHMGLPRNIPPPVELYKQPGRKLLARRSHRVNFVQINTGILACSREGDVTGPRITKAPTFRCQIQRMSLREPVGYARRERTLFLSRNRRWQGDNQIKRSALAIRNDGAKVRFLICRKIPTCHIT